MLTSRLHNHGAELVIQTDGHAAHTRVWLNRQEISKCLQAVTVRVAEREVTTAELMIAVDRVQIDAQSLAALTALVKGRADSDGPASEVVVTPAVNEGWGEEAADDADD